MMMAIAQFFRNLAVLACMLMVGIPGGCLVVPNGIKMFFLDPSDWEYCEAQKKVWKGIVLCVLALIISFFRV